ncbi:MAG: ABC transporter permease subunit [Chlamydiales bacterium]
MTDSYCKIIWRQFRRNTMGFVALLFFLSLFFIGLYAPLLTSSKPILVLWDKKLYFPLFRYLFYKGFFSKPIDLFYNLLMFTLPILVLGIIFLKARWKKFFVLFMISVQFALFFYVMTGVVKDPKSNRQLLEEKQNVLQQQLSYHEDPMLSPLTPYPSWNFELKYLTPYAKLNQLLRHEQRKNQHLRFAPYREKYVAKMGHDMTTLWNVDQKREHEKRALLEQTIQLTQKKYDLALERLPELIAEYRPFSHDYLMAKFDLERAQQRLDVHSDHPQSSHYGEALQTVFLAQEKLQDAISRATPTRAPLEQARLIIQKYREATAQLHYLDEREEWIAQESAKLHVLVPTFLRPFHWEDDAGGAQIVNKYVSWWDLTRINRKDLIASLIFGIRVSLVVGFSAVFLSLCIGIPLGTFSGYFAGKFDLIVCRIVEVWEAMPTFFMLLLIVAITQSKSIFLVIAVLGIFGWTTFCRFMRAEVLKQRSLPYVLACKSLGFKHMKIMFSHILPNAIPPILTLLPFSLMAAITSEAGLSFLGLGEEGSSSWGVLMDEGRSVFPGESYLLWPPAILLTLLLISIALVGDALRDAIDPKLRS